MHTRSQRLLALALVFVCQEIVAAEVRTDATVTKAGYREGPPPGKQWKMVWNDEFDGASLDTGKWSLMSLPNWTWPGQRPGRKSRTCSWTGKVALVIRLTKEPDGTVCYARGVQSKLRKAYGYYETRVKFSKQPGWWTAVWLTGIPYNCGADAFLHPQEFDIFEDFYKPKTQNDVGHCYHCSVNLAFLGDQGNAKGVGEGDILGSKTLGRTSNGRKVILEAYEGWHTVGFQWTPLEHIFYVDGQETLRQDYRNVPVTCVPQHVWITGEYRTPEHKDARPFYGRLEEAQLPDSLIVDYVRIYDEDTGDRRPPRVTLAPAGGKPPFQEGDTIAFDVSAETSGGRSRTSCSSPWAAFVPNSRRIPFR